MGAQIISFCIVCAVLYKFAYRRILAMLDERRQQIATGLENAEKIKAELDKTKAQRQEVMAQAYAESAKFIEEARAAASKVLERETQKAIATAERCGEIAAVCRERKEMNYITEIVGNSPNQVSGLAIEYVNWMFAVAHLGPSPGCDRRPIRADRHSVHVAHLLRPDRNPDRAQQLSICDRPDPHCAIVGAGRCEAPSGVDG